MSLPLDRILASRGQSVPCITTPSGLAHGTKRSGGSRKCAALLLTFASAIALFPAATQAQSLWEEVAGKSAQECAIDLPRFAVARSCVIVDGEMARAAAAQPGSMPLQIQTPNGTFEVTLDRSDYRSPTSYSLFGVIGENRVERFQLTHVDGVTLIWMTAGGVSWRVEPGTDGLSVLLEIDERQRPRAVEDALISPNPTGLLSPPTRPNLGVSELAASTVDVLVLYTSGVQTRLGTSGVAALMQEYEDWLNQALANDNVSQVSFRIVHSEETTYVPQASMSTDLDRLQDTSDGWMDDVHALRQSVGADLVHLVVPDDDGSACGYGFRNDGWMVPEFGFAVTAESCGADTFAHEIGHNMAMHHDTYVVPVGNEAAWPWAYGFVDPAYEFSTVMAYLNQCIAVGEYCPTIQYFSDPNITYTGVPIGLPPAGSGRSADNVRVIEETAAFIDDYSDFLHPSCSWGFSGSAADSVVPLGSSGNAAVTAHNSAVTECPLERFHIIASSSGFDDRSAIFVLGSSDVAVAGSASTLLEAQYSPSALGMAPGDYTIRLLIEREGGYLNIGTTTIQAVGSPPTAVIAATPSSGEPPLTVEFSGAGSSDPDGDTLSYAWDFGDGSTGTGVSVSNTYASEGNFTATLEVSDGIYTDSDTQVISVVNVNDAPVFTSVPVEAATEDALYSYTITAQDADPGDNLTISGTFPIWLQLTSQGSGSALLEGTPDNGDVGSHAVSLTVTDTAGATGGQSFSITVANTNDAPTFTSDPVSEAVEEQPYSYAITTSDVDLADTRSLSGSFPDWLTLADNNDGTGTLSGTPAQGDVGVAAISLTVTDAAGGAAQQDFSITVANTNDPPTFTSTPVTTADEDALYTYTVMAQDVDPGDVLTITGTFPDWLTLSSQGAGSALLRGTPANDDVGTHQVALNVTDAAGVSAEQTFQVSVANTNDAPFFSSDPEVQAQEGALYSYPITTSDVDLADTRDLSGNYPDWLTLTDNGDGTGTLFGTPGQAAVGQAAVSLTVTDAAGAPTEQTFTIIVANSNDAPTFATTPVTVATEDALYAYSIGAEDADPGDALLFSGAYPDWLQLSSAGSRVGMLQGTPTNDDVGSHAVTLRVTDPSGAFAEQNFSVTVTNTNDAPAFSSDPVVQAWQGDAYTYEIATSDVDAFDTRALTGTYPEWLALADNGDGTGTLSGTPAQGDVGDAAVSLTVTDAAGAAAQQSFTITVADNNDPPTFVSTPVTLAAEDAPYIYNIEAEDADPGDALLFSGAYPDWLGLSSEGSRVGMLQGTPTNDDVGSHAVTLRVTDPSGAFAEQTFSITVTNTNDAPVFSSDPVLEADEGAAYSYAVTTSDTDPADTRSLSGSYPGWLALTDNGDGTGTLAGIPTQSDVGSAQVTLTVTDAAGAAAEQRFVIVVTDRNDTPVFTSDPVTEATEDAPYSYAVQAQDADQADVLAITGTYPNWLQLVSQSAGTALLEGTPTNDNVGIHTVALVVTDAAGASAEQRFTVTVVNTNDPPLFTSAPPVEAREDEPYAYLVETTDVDAADTHSLSGSYPDWLSLDDNGDGSGTLSGTPAQADGGSAAIALTVTDLAGETAEQVFTITVELVNEPPTAIATADEVNEDGSVAIELAGVDPDGDPLTFQLASPPSHGEASISGSTALYEPFPDFNGSDSFSIAAFDGELVSAPALVEVTVRPTGTAMLQVINLASAFLAVDFYANGGLLLDGLPRGEATGFLEIPDDVFLAVSRDFATNDQSPLVAVDAP